MLLLGALHTAAAVESYRDFIARATPQPPLALADLPDISGLVAENEQSLDRLTADRPASVASPTADARVAVPLLVQAVRDWSADGTAQRASSYAPVLAGLRERIDHSPQQQLRILVPGSGLGRLAFDVAEDFAGSEVVAVEPDVHAQVMAAQLMQPPDAEACAAESERAAAAPDASGRRAGAGQRALYPAIHLRTNWAAAEDRLRAVFVPDVSRERLARVQREANLSLVVGSFPEAFEGGGSDAAELAGRGFDAVATVFFVDVLADLRAALATLRDLLAPTRGLWVNNGPLAFPEARGEARGGTVAYPLAYDQLRPLVLAAGFELLEEHQLPCEYNHLPGQLERRVNTCFYWVARPTASAQTIYSRTNRRHADSKSK